MEKQINQAKPRFMYHISNVIPENETMIKPHKNVDQTGENEDYYVFASPKPNYISCFRGKHSIFRGGTTDADGTRIGFVVTPDIEKTREFMKTRPAKIYTLSSETFSQVVDKRGNIRNEWVSKAEVPILDKREIQYEEILENLQVFYLELKEYNMEKYREYVNNTLQKFSNIKVVLKQLVDWK